MSLIDAVESAVERSSGKSKRVLVLTASVGEGHNSAATAITEMLLAARPDCEAQVLDVFASARGDAGGRVQRRYRLAVEVFPLGYQLWYDAVASWDWCHAYYRRVAGARMGRLLRDKIAEFGPDVVVSTYPLATAGLAWLRRTGVLEAPVLAFLSDFAPHRFWVYPGVDEYLVLSERGRAVLRRLARDVPIRVCPPAVRADLRPRTADQTRRARADLGLPADALIVLVSAGAMAMGSVSRTVRAVRASGAHPVVTVGRNERLGRSLRRRYPDGEVTVLGWTDDMTHLIGACDAVVNNAGGATAAETLASGRALVMFQAIPGHGRASAAMMARAGLASVCSGHRALSALLARWAEEPWLLRAAQRRAENYVGARSRDEITAAVLARLDAPARR